MADNVTLNLGAGGDTIATEDIGAVKFQKIKLVDSTPGSSTPVGTAANPLNVAAATLPLPAGAATGAKQDTGNTSVASIDTKTPALGQALAAASVPVVLTAAQITTLTPPAAIAGFALEAGHLAAIDTKTPALGAAATAASTPVNVASDQVVPVSAAALPLPSGAATETTLVKLALAQGADGTSTPGPMVQAVVNDAVENYTSGAVQPLSLTTQGRLRVSSLPANTYMNFFDDISMGGDAPNTNPFGFVNTPANAPYSF